MRTCKSCGHEKPLADFYRQPSGGFMGRCKECVKERARQYRSDNLERVQEYDRQRGLLPHRKAAVAARAHRYKNDTKKFREQNPEKYKAHNIVNNAIRDGKLIVQPCERCGYAIGVHAHHESYEKPLEVTWLCKPCHGERHREINAERRKAAF